MTIKAVIRGASGTAMIDGTWRNMSYFNKRTVNAGVNLNIARNNDYVMWAYRCEISAGGMLTTSTNKNAYDWQTKDYYSLSAQMEIYEYADLPVERDPLGLNIKNELGILVFSTKVKPLRVLAHVVGSISSGQTDSTVTLYDGYFASGRKYAVMIGDAPCVLNARSDGFSMRSLTVYTGTDGQVTVKYDIRVFSGETGAYRGQVFVSSRYSFQIIDVTGY